MPRRKKGLQEEITSLVLILLVGGYFGFPEHFKTLVFSLVSIGLVVLGLAVYLSFRKKQASNPKATSKFVSTNAKAKNTELSKPLAPKPSSPSTAAPTSAPSQWTLALIKSLDWKVFEELCAAYFVAKGWRAEVTGAGADGGVDILLYRSNQPDKVLGVIQCKAWGKKLIGVKAIRELFGVMHDAGCELGVFVSASGYTADATRFAKDKKIKLLDTETLLKLILELPIDSQTQLLKEMTKGDYRTPSCPRCETKLIKRQVKKGRNQGSSFWGCASFPKCRYTMQERKASLNWVSH